MEYGQERKWVNRVQRLRIEEKKLDKLDIYPISSGGEHLVLLHYVHLINQSYHGPAGIKNATNVTKVNLISLLTFLNQLYMYITFSENFMTVSFLLTL